MDFNADGTKSQMILWIRRWFKENADGYGAVVGISGGKDSSVVAALCAEALGKEHVTGILMPNGLQNDIDVSKSIVKYLQIKSIEINIEDSYADILNQLSFYTDLREQTKINLAPRLRMSVLYAAAQSIRAMVANTSNLSEAWIGYATKYGDSAGDFAPLLDLTVTEVKAVGYALGLPAEFIEKVPGDGLSGKSDEDNIGFTYNTLDKYIRTGVCEDIEIKNKIDFLHYKNKFKSLPIQRFEYTPHTKI